MFFPCFAQKHGPMAAVSVSEFIRTFKIAVPEMPAKNNHTIT